MTTVITEFDNMVGAGNVVKSGRREFFLAGAHFFLAAFFAIASMFFSGPFLLVAFLINSIVYIAVATGLRRSGPIHLDLIFLAFLLIYSISVPISNSIFPKGYYELGAIKQATEISLVAYLGFSAGLLLLSGRHRKVASISALRESDIAAIRKSGITVFFLGILMSVGALVLTTGLSAYLSAGYAGRALLKREVGPIEIGLYVCIVGLFAMMVSVLLSEATTRATKYVILFSFIFFFFYISFLGIRRPLFLLGLGLLSGYSLIRHKPRVLSLFLLMIPAFLFLTTFAEYRQLISSAGISETIEFIRKNASWEWIDVSDSELGAPFRTLYDHLFFYNGDIDFRFGSTYLEVPLYILPSSIAGEVQSLSVEYTKAFFSNDFISIGGNMGFSPVTEAYLNFGIFGVAAMFALFGLGLSRANIWFHARGRFNVVAATLFMMLIPWTAFFMRLDMASFAKGFLYSQLLPLLLIVLLAKLFKPKARFRH